MKRVAVLGAGSWGTAVAMSLSRRHEVVLWGRDPAQVAAMEAQRQNSRYLPGQFFPSNLKLTSEFGNALNAAVDLLVIGVPLSGLRGVVDAIQSDTAWMRRSCGLVLLCKGIDSSTLERPSQIVAKKLALPVAALSGPSFAKELAQGLPTAVVLSGESDRFIAHAQSLLHGDSLRVYASHDLVGVEIGGAAKNIVAIAAGISDGLGLGSNARAALITRGLSEITRLALAMGGQTQTLSGLAGMGDLVLTCTGDGSRNRRVGLALAKGQSLDRILSELGQVSEGVGSAKAIYQLSIQYGVDMPIARSVKQVLYESYSPNQAFAELMSRDVGWEF